MATISVPGGNSAPPLVFTVTGTSTSNIATDFQTALDNAVKMSSLTVNVLSNGASQQPVGSGAVLNEMLGQTMMSSYTLQNGNEYSLALVPIATTINGSAAGGDTVVAGGQITYEANGSDITVHGNVTYNAVGGNDNVDFVAGTNIFYGDSANGDTVTGGSGADSIFTGTGVTTVFSGAGNTLIDLGDTSNATTQGDLVYLGDGHATVNANGGNDTVATGTNGQVIFGGAGELLVNITDNATSSGAAGDTITGGSGTTTVFDSVGGNQILGGSGALTFVGETGTFTDSVVAGSGSTAIFGASGNTIAFSSTSTSGGLAVMAGTGNETLNGATAGDFSVWANTTDTASSLVAYGGTGTDYFATGTGSESLYGGTGANVFALDTTGAGGNISIYNWSGADSVSTDAANQSALDNGTTVTGANGEVDYVVKLSDDTTVTFVGVNSLSGHII